MTPDVVIDAIPSVISGACLIAVALINAGAQRERKKLETERAAHEAAIAKEHTREEHRAEVRKEESRLSMAMMAAMCDLGLAQSLAITGHTQDHEMERATASVKAAQQAYNDFMIRQTADNI